jgi:hypothetical protein
VWKSYFWLRLFPWCVHNYDSKVVGYFKGLELAFDHGFRAIDIESDLKAAFQLIMKEYILVTLCFREENREGNGFNAEEWI